MADDFEIEAAGRDYGAGLVLIFVLCDLLGFPISWNKVTAGEEISWIGFEILLHSYSLGVTASRNDWAILWCTKLLEDGCGHTETLADGLGWLSFMCGALETLRTFLSPLYAVINLVGPGVRAEFPPCILVTLRYFTDALKVRHHHVAGKHFCETGCGSTHKHPRRLGGWRPVRGGEDQIQTALFPWFHVRLTPANCPWAFARDGAAFRVIASLEALATLLATMYLTPGADEHRQHSEVMWTRVLTDNRGNGSCLNKLATSRYPLSAVVVEMATDSTRIADEHRVTIDFPGIKWVVLDRALAWGAEFAQQAAARKAAATSGAIGPRART